VLTPTAAGVPPATSWDTPYKASVAAILRVVDEVIAVYKMDPTRIHANGFSQGAYMIWLLLGARPALWASLAASSAGGGYSALHGPPRTQVPIWYQHGTHDGLVPIANGRSTIARVVKEWDLGEGNSTTHHGYNRTRYSNEHGTEVVFTEHQYGSEPVGPLPCWGHCFVGSKDQADVPLLPTQIMHWGCPTKEQAGYSYGEEAFAFFRLHTKADK